jgi:hypothetical protein
MVRTLNFVTVMAAVVSAARVDPLRAEMEEMPYAKTPSLLDVQTSGRRRPDGEAKRKKNKAKHMQLESLHIKNKCAMPVYFREGQSQKDGPFKIEQGKTAVFTGDEPGLRLEQRLSFSYGKRMRDTDGASVVEIGRGFKKFHEPVKHFQMVFANKFSFLDLNLRISLWKDKIGGTLSCEDGSAQTAFKMSECEQSDGSSKIVEKKTPDGQTFKVCEAKFRPDYTDFKKPVYDPRSCTADYARYVNSKSFLYQPSTDSWVPSADSVGIDQFNFTHAKYSDGSTKSSTLSGRDGGRRAVNGECFEMPCRWDKDGSCKANGQVPMGNVGFAKCSYNGPVAQFGVMEVVLCPDAVNSE